METTSSNRRQDAKTANTVRSGLVILEACGTKLAAQWMHLHGVPFPVAHKVITRPWLRRQEDFVIVGKWWHAISPCLAEGN